MRKTIDVDLCEFSIDDLVEELERRQRLDYRVVDLRIHFSAQHGIECLKRAGCPEELTDPIEEWARQPVANEQALREWLEFCSARNEGGT